MAEEQKIMEHLKINQLATKPKTKKAFGVMGKDFVYIVHRFVDLYDIEDVVDKISNTKLRYMSNEAVYKDDEYNSGMEYSELISRNGHLIKQKNSIKIAPLGNYVLTGVGRNKILPFEDYEKLYLKYQKLIENENKMKYKYENTVLSNGKTRKTSARMKTKIKIMQRENDKRKNEIEKIIEPLLLDNLDKLTDKEYKMLFKANEKPIKTKKLNDIEYLLERAESLKTLIHETSHLFAKSELVLKDKNGNEIPLELIKTKSAKNGELEVYFGGIKFDSFPLNNKGNFHKENENVLSIPPAEFNIMLHEGITEFVTQKLINSGCFKELDESGVFLDADVQKDLETYQCYQKYIKMIDALNPTVFENTHFGGRQNFKLENLKDEFFENFSTLVDISCEVEDALSKYVDDESENYMDTKRLLENYENIIKKVDCFLNDENTKVLDLFKQQKLSEQQVVNYVKARNSFINEDMWCSYFWFDELDNKDKNKLNKITKKQLEKYYINCKNEKGVIENMEKSQKHEEATVYTIGGENKITIEEFKARRNWENTKKHIQNTKGVKKSKTSSNTNQEQRQA